MVSNSKSNLTDEIGRFNGQIREIEIAPDQIKIGNRRRKSLDNLEPLKNSIKRWGFSIHDVVINQYGFLVAGHRRLESFKELGFKTIRVKVVPIKTEDIKYAEYEENVLREDFTVSELVADFDDIASNRIGHRLANGKLSKLDTFQLETKGKSTADIMAEITGKSRGYLYDARELVHLVNDNRGNLELKTILDNVNADPIKYSLHDGLKKAKYTLFDLQQKANDEANSKVYNALSFEDKINFLNIGDFNILGHDDRIVKANSVDLLWTDPYYHKKYLILYKEVARLADRVLEEGGSLIVYAPDDLPTALDYIRKDGNVNGNLHYVGLITVHLKGDISRNFEAGMTRKLKHLLWFVKGEKQKNYRFSSDNTGYEKDDFIRARLLSNLIESEVPDKRFHHMSQSHIEAQYCFDALVPINGLVLDPMLGGGTTAIACINTTRRFIGIDIDPKSIKATKRNLARAAYVLTEN